jgi:hypothetical protein
MHKMEASLFGVIYLHFNESIFHLKEGSSTS